MEGKNIVINANLLKEIKILAVREEKTLKKKIGELIKKELIEKGILIE